MMDMCDGNQYAIDKHLAEQERAEQNFEYMLKQMEKEIEEIGERINELQVEARDYNGYSFEEDLNEVLGDLIWLF